MWMVANCRNGVSSWEMHRTLGVTQKSAWFMLHRLRLAMQDDLTGGSLNGQIEVDETFIGGKVRNMHKDRKERAQKRSKHGDKTIVLGVLERASEAKPKRVRATVIPNRKKETLREEVRGTVAKGAEIHSDDLGNNWRMDDEYTHNIVNHLETYVQGNVHTNTLENFWSLLKRGVGGTYIAVEPFHLFRYVDEQAFRFNNRKHADGEVVNDEERFSRLCLQIVGKRLTYAQLTDETNKKQVVEEF